jgi:protein SCO1/2
MVEPIFISVDPKRDTPEVVKNYIKGKCSFSHTLFNTVAEFHPRFKGLTGSEEQVREAAKAYRIYISRGDAINGDENDYLVDHSIFFLFVNPDGDFSDFFGRTATAEDIVDKVAKSVRAWKQQKAAGRV